MLEAMGCKLIDLSAPNGNVKVSGVIQDAQPLKDPYNI